MGRTGEDDRCEVKGPGQGEVNGVGFGGEALDHEVEGLMGCNGMRIDRDGAGWIGVREWKLGSLVGAVGAKKNSFKDPI